MNCALHNYVFIISAKEKNMFISIDNKHRKDMNIKWDKTSEPLNTLTIKWKIT